MEDNRALFSRWRSEIEFAQKDKKYVTWLQESDKIGRRYRDERDDNTSIPLTSSRRFNMLWSNVQVLRPAVYAKMPQPVVQRRFLDRDPVARTASMVLERTVYFQMEASTYHETTNRAVLDYLLPGMGQAWVRYEPEFESAEIAADNEAVEAKEHAQEGKDEEDAEDVAQEGDGAPHERVAYERVAVDYVFFKDFLWSASRGWSDVRWVAKRSFLSRSEIAERFFDNDMEKAGKINLDWSSSRTAERSTYVADDDQSPEFVKKAAIWEIWNKPDRKVYFIAPGSGEDSGLLEVRPDPLKLKGFWPCPEPLFATQTNDTLIPVPDYHEYKDQAQEVDDLTDRIARITQAVKAAGVYDASFPALQRLLQQGQDNQLIPVDTWAAFAEKGGTPGAISLLPMKEIVDVLHTLFEARERQVAQANQITGISDIVRGQGEGGAKTATEQRIKGQFATLRLQDRQATVARFCRDLVRLIAEIASEHFSEASLLEMSGYRQIVQDDAQKAAASVPPPPQGAPPGMASPGQMAPPVGINGGPPMPPAGMMAPPDPMMLHQQQVAQARQQAEAKALEEFAAAIQLLRSDKLRGFRIDIETDSTIQIDAQADKESAIELVTATLQGLGNAGPIVMQAPELIEPIGDLLMFAFRRFRVGRQIEGTLEAALDKIEERMKGPKPPSPEQVKAQTEQKQAEMEMAAEQQRQQAETQRAVMEFQANQAKMQEERAADQQEFEARMAEMAMEAERSREEHAFKMAELAAKIQAMEAKAILDERTAEIQAEATERQAELGAEADERKHELSMEAAEKKAEGNGDDA